MPTNILFPIPQARGHLNPPGHIYIAPSQQNRSSQNNPITGERINAELQDHAAGLQDWNYSEQIRLFHDWTAIFDSEFRLGLQTPAIQLESIGTRRLGCYRIGRNGFGLKHQITINAKYLDRPLAQQLEVLFHELLHEWQTLYGSYGKAARSNYHNRQFQNKAALYGLIVDAKGHHVWIEPGRFTNLLRQRGVDMSTLRNPHEKSLSAARRVRGESKYKKWSCGCTNARAVKLVAHCDQCGNVFEEATPAW